MPAPRRCAGREFGTGRTGSSAPVRPHVLCDGTDGVPVDILPLEGSHAVTFPYLLDGPVGPAPVPLIADQRIQSGLVGIRTDQVIDSYPYAPYRPERDLVEEVHGDPVYLDRICASPGDLIDRERCPVAVGTDHNHASPALAVHRHVLRDVHGHEEHDVG